MTNLEVQTIVAKLDWDYTEAEREISDSILGSISDNQIYLLLFKLNEKKYWRGCAQMIVKLNYERLRNILPGIFEWLQDPNWPGYIIIFNYLASLQGNEIHAILDAAIYRAAETHDGDWMASLKRLYDIYKNAGEVNLSKSSYSMFSIAQW